MKIAIMQPYYFPYYGYFKLMKEVDLFVLYDDVQYIRRGWVNRNRLLSNQGIPRYITIPVKKNHRNCPINRMEISGWDWHRNHIRAMKSYKGASKHRMVEEISSIQPTESLVYLLEQTLLIAASFLGIEVNFSKSSQIGSKGVGQSRILDICESLGAREYWNLPGGRSLYDEEDFKKRGIDLNFIDPPQGGVNLSILHDILVGDR
jgi:hypothetical protein